MLEQLHTTPEERRKTEIFLHVGIVAFALYSFAELLVRLGATAVIAGTAAGLLGFVYSQALRGRRRENPRWSRTMDGRYHLRAM